MTADQLREAYLPRIYQHRSLVRRIKQRLSFTRHHLHARAKSATGVSQTLAAVDLLYSTWLLIEQTRKAYEVVASHVDVRFRGQRRSLDSRINNRRSEARSATYHQQVWLSPLLDYVPDSAFMRLGLEPVASRAMLKEIMRRSAARLVEEELLLREFAQKYDSVCSAYKHGRAVFTLRTVVDEINASTNIRLADSDEMVTVLRSPTPGASPDALVTLLPDAEFWLDIDRALSLLDGQIPRFHAFIESVTTCIEAALRQILAGTNEPLPTIPHFVFSEPRSASEATLLEALNGDGLLLYERDVRQP